MIFKALRIFFIPRYSPLPPLKPFVELNFEGKLGAERKLVKKKKKKTRSREALFLGKRQRHENYSQ